MAEGTDITDKPVRPRPAKLVDREFEELRQRIEDGNCPPDTRLPGEHELAATLGVSRPIIRDALGRLREQGIDYSRQGAGTFVQALCRRRRSWPIRGSKPLPTSSAATSSA